MNRRDYSTFTSRIESAESLVGFSRERQKTLDRLAEEIQTGAGYLSFAEPNELLPRTLAYHERWQEEVANFLGDQTGSDARLRFLNASVPVQGRAVTLPFVNDNSRSCEAAPWTTPLP